MNRVYTKARFWKCALQVNPASYIAYRGKEHAMSPEQYNQKLVDLVLENEIKVIGLANHGNVAETDAIRNAMNAQKIIVFPGFEIASSEKVHFVCLYPEKTSVDELNRYLGNLELLDIKDGIRPSKLSAEYLIKKVEEDQKGFIFAAHCTQKNGLLFQKLNHIWQNPLLKAAQIPATIEDLKNKEGNAYRQILLNKDPAYKRELPIGIINASDVAIPEDLANPRATSLIKMTQPGFESFKLAFQDPHSRVRLNSDVSEKYYSRIEKLKITGGYLDTVEIEFSEHLNTVIGGRGTGKSTLLECIRYALNLRPTGKNAQKQHDEIIKENLGKAKARIELWIRSSRMNGKRFILARRYGENTSICDENGNPSNFTPADLLPEIEIYGQNEISEIAQDRTCHHYLLRRFLQSEQQEEETKIKRIILKLSENRGKLIDIYDKIAAIEDDIAKLPKLEEEVNQFKTLGLEEKLKVVPLLETEKRLLKRAQTEEGINLNQAFQSLRDNLPDTTFLSDAALKKLPHAEGLRKIKAVLDSLRLEAELLLDQWQGKYSKSQPIIDKLAAEVTAKIEEEENALEATFKALPSSEGKSGSQIGREFQALLQDIERIRPKTIEKATQFNLLKELQNGRKALLAELSEMRANRSAEFARILKRVNKSLAGKLKLEIKPEADRQPLVDFLLQCNLDNVGVARLAWINTADDFSVTKLAEVIREGVDSLTQADWGITNTVATALSKMSKSQILQLEELELPDVINIELNVAHDGSELFKPIDKLSAGQKCTAILHLLLLHNLDPLIMDQPEDNLDNAFIANRIVGELRTAKMARQFLFATHNANIPVFGDAEWIGVFEADEKQARMPLNSQGAVDVQAVRDLAATILEGGKAAFNQRKAKYGF